MAKTAAGVQLAIGAELLVGRLDDVRIGVDVVLVLLGLLLLLLLLKLELLLRLKRLLLPNKTQNKRGGSFFLFN